MKTKQLPACVITLFILLLIFSCRSENIEPLNKNNGFQNSNKKISLLTEKKLDNIIDTVRTHIKSNSLKLSLSKISQNSKNISNFGKISSDFVVEINYPQQSYFVMKIVPEIPDNIIYNLELIQVDGKIQKERIVAYKPTQEWIEKGNNNFNKFTGSVSYYTISGELTSTTQYTNGTSECGEQNSGNGGGGGTGNGDTSWDYSGWDNGGGNGNGNWGNDGGGNNDGNGGGGNSDCSWVSIINDGEVVGKYNTCTGQVFYLLQADKTYVPHDSTTNKTNGNTGTTVGCGDGSGVVISDVSNFNFDDYNSINADWLRNHLGIVLKISQTQSQNPNFDLSLYNDIINFGINKSPDFIYWAVDFLYENQDMDKDQFEGAFLTGNDFSPQQMGDYMSDLSDPDRVKPTIKFKKNLKINAIYNQAKTAANFNQYLQNFEPTFSVAHLMLDVGNVSDQNYLAETSYPKNYWMSIVFNQNKDWSNIPKIVIAETFMHEIIHAEMHRKLLSISSTPNGNIDWNTVNQLLNTHNYPGLFDYYVRFIKSPSDAEHQAMGAHYVNIIVNFLKQIYGSKYSELEYKSIVWLDLQNTVAWSLLSQSEKDLYQQTWNTNYWLWGR